MKINDLFIICNILLLAIIAFVVSSNKEILEPNKIVKPKQSVRYLATCYSADKIIFERDGIFVDGYFDCGNKRYKLPDNCLLEVLKQ